MSTDTILAFFIGLIPALVVLIVEGRRNRITLQANLLLNLNEQWCSTEMKMLRKAASRKLLRNAIPNYELGELLDFFSMICYLYRARATNADLLYKQFGWWIIGYWLASKDWIQNARNIDPDGWKTFEEVAKSFVAREEVSKYPLPTNEVLRLFLTLETKLFMPRRIN